LYFLCGAGAAVLKLAMEKHCVPNSELPEWAKPKSKGAPSEVKTDAFAAAKNFSVFVGTSFLVFASILNSLTCVSKPFHEDAWTYFYHDICKDNEFILATVGCSVFTIVYFWLNSLFFLYLDIFQPAYFMRYKIQDEEKVTMPQLLRTIPLCIFNQFLTLLCSIPLYHAATIRGMPFTAVKLGSFQWFLFELVIYILVEEVGFYYCHRLMHHPRLYKHIHKVHHEWTASISMISMYVHPVEHVVSSILPVFLGPFVMGSHFANLLLWSCIAISSTQISHSGYHLPFLPSPEAHDFHHLKFTNNFGVLGVLDRLHGTDASFRKTKAYDRHIMLVGFTPAIELFPEENKRRNFPKELFPEENKRRNSF